MLKTNLSTRPFAHARAVQLVLGALGAVVLLATALNVVQYVRLAALERTVGAQASEAEAEAARLRTDAARVRAQLNPQEVDRVQAAAREANAIIDQRAFSWTELFVGLERTLPADARITAVQPRLDRDGRFVVSIGVESRRVEDLDAFIEALEADASFERVLAVQEEVTEDGLVEAAVEGAYVLPVPGTTARSPEGAPADAALAAQAPAGGGGD
ncbi:MAG: hypothetical protein AB7G23_04285 [Vicinamibacterales bacterium]